MFVFTCILYTYIYMCTFTTALFSTVYFLLPSSYFYLVLCTMLYGFSCICFFAFFMFHFYVSSFGLYVFGCLFYLCSISIFLLMLTLLLVRTIILLFRLNLQLHTYVKSTHVMPLWCELKSRSMQLPTMLNFHCFFQLCLAARWQWCHLTMQLGSPLLAEHGKRCVSWMVCTNVPRITWTLLWS